MQKVDDLATWVLVGEKGGMPGVGGNEPEPARQRRSVRLQASGKQVSGATDLLTHPIYKAYICNKKRGLISARYRVSTAHLQSFSACCGQWDLVRPDQNIRRDRRFCPAIPGIDAAGQSLGNEPGVPLQGGAGDGRLVTNITVKPIQCYCVLPSVPMFLSNLRIDS